MHQRTNITNRFGFFVVQIEESAAGKNDWRCRIGHHHDKIASHRATAQVPWAASNGIDDTHTLPLDGVTDVAMDEQCAQREDEHLNQIDVIDYRAGYLGRRKR